MKPDDPGIARRWAMISAGLALSALLTWLVWRWLGPIAFAICAPLFGIVLARGLIDGASWLRHAGHRRALRDVEGRHYAFHGHAIDILEDDEGPRWLRHADVAKIVPGLMAPAVMARLHPDGVRDAQRPARARVRADVLDQLLLRSTQATTLKFRHWLQREVIFPSVHGRGPGAAVVPGADRPPGLR
ncbi:MAG: hypothetical protein ACKVQR_01645 [Aquabacterium sp.]